MHSDHKRHRLREQLLDRQGVAGVLDPEATGQGEGDFVGDTCSPIEYEDSGFLLFVHTRCLGVFVYILKAIWQAFKLDRAAKENISDTECVACGSKKLDELAPKAYRCLSCGYEGGSGLAAAHEAAARREVDRLSPERKRAKARKELEDARSLLSAATGTLDGAVIASVHDIIGIGSDPSGIAGEGSEKQQLMQRALQDAEQARALIKDALYLLGDDADAGRPEDIGMGMAAADIYFDNPLTDLMMAGRIEQLKDTVRGLTALAERLLASMG
ncbi:MAG TPA: hypothetical protein QGF58_16090 [Myxococcota bacterium]|nr:hypothetical protein [Myxococcota bacterium]